MNILFAVLLLLTGCICLVTAPNLFLETLLKGASQSAVLCFSLIANYAVWLGLMQVWQDSGLTRALSKRMQPFAKKIFHIDDVQTLDILSMNIAVNMLGISGAATPYGIQVANRLHSSDNAEYASAMFFVLNATSLQILPTSMIGVRTALGSQAPALIILPTFLVSALSTLLAMSLVWLLIAKKTKKPSNKRTVFAKPLCKTRGTGMQ